MSVSSDARISLSAWEDSPNEYKHCCGCGSTLQEAVERFGKVAELRLNAVERRRAEARRLLDEATKL